MAGAMLGNASWSTRVYTTGNIEAVDSLTRTGFFYDMINGFVATDNPNQAHPAPKESSVRDDVFFNLKVLLYKIADRIRQMHMQLFKDGRLGDTQWDKLCRVTIFIKSRRIELANVGPLEYALTNLPDKNIKPKSKWERGDRFARPEAGAILGGQNWARAVWAYADPNEVADSNFSANVESMKHVLVQSGGLSTPPTITGREGNEPGFRVIFNKPDLIAIHENGMDIGVTPKMRNFLHSIGWHIAMEKKWIHIPRRPIIGAITKELEKLLPSIIAEWQKEYAVMNRDRGYRREPAYVLQSIRSKAADVKLKTGEWSMMDYQKWVNTSKMNYLQDVGHSYNPSRGFNMDNPAFHEYGWVKGYDK
jgi:hypothetical protein